jgi:hypothetical protein
VEENVVRIKEVRLPIVWVFAFCLASTTLVAEPAKVAGQWNFTVELEMGTGHPVVTFKQDGEKLTGTYDGRYGQSPLEGTIREKRIEFTVTMVAEGVSVAGVFSGSVDGETMSGTVEFDQAGEGTWSATRPATKK